MTLLGKTDHYFTQHGAAATAREINQQGACWQQIPELIRSLTTTQCQQISTALHNPQAVIIFSGAGTSGYVGDILAPALTQYAPSVCLSRHSTDLVSQPAACLPRNAQGLLFAFARSGNSPESIDSLDKVAAISPAISPVSVTCNAQGMLAKKTHADNGIACLMPERTHDESFVMTSSFSTMTLFTSMLCRQLLGAPTHDIDLLAAESMRINTTFYTSNICAQIANAKRLIYLGSNSLWGAARESALKILEMTAGKIPTMAETSLGFRHGPKSLIDSDTITVIFASNDCYTQQFDADIARELAKDGKCSAVIVAGSTQFFLRFPDIAQLSSIYCLPFSSALDNCADDALSVLYVNYGQLIGLAAAIACGVSADNPSLDGSVNRVVQGVRLYPYSTPA